MEVFNYSLYLTAFSCPSASPSIMVIIWMKITVLTVFEYVWVKLGTLRHEAVLLPTWCIKLCSIITCRLASAVWVFIFNKSCHSPKDYHKAFTNSSVHFLHFLCTVSLHKMHKASGSCEPSQVWHMTEDWKSMPQNGKFFFYLSVSVVIILGERTQKEMWLN